MAYHGERALHLRRKDFRYSDTAGYIFLSEMTYPHVLFSAQSVLTLLPSRLYCCLEVFGFSKIFSDISVDPVLSNRSFSRCQEIF